MTEPDAQLAAIKARHQVVRDQINAPDLPIGYVVKSEMGAGLGQIGLTEVFIDKHNRLWRNADGGGAMVLVFDPNPSDPQAAHGFKAHEG